MTSNNKTANHLKCLLQSPQLSLLMEAHNGLSARIVEDTGFCGIWASGLSISAALGVRDCNEASWTQILEVIEFMRDAAPNTPILMDGDTGFGNFNNVRRLVRKLEQRQVSGVCLEDKVFPKRNSFIEGVQELADPIEFSGKIRAAKDSQCGGDFAVIARTEGFIAGLPLDEVLGRADCYYEAGADAILVHSKRSDASEILAFAKAWDRPCPLVIVPTTYGDTPTAVFEEAGISAVIWANHNMRASITAMQTACQVIFKQQSIRAVEERIAPLSEVFRLQNSEELAQAEKRYLGHASLPPVEAVPSDV
jgi:phosphoenolpyruvate phosphomutase